MGKKEPLAHRFVYRLSMDRKRRWGVKLIDEETSTIPTIHVDHPSGLVMLTGYLKRLANDGSIKASVYCRGECKRHNTLVPSLFRLAKTQKKVKKLIAAEEELENEIKKTFIYMSRFSERYITAILQHYGIQTSWIDLVDNLYIAVWFALNERLKLKSGNYFYKQSEQKTGWIHFLQTRVEGQPALRYRDLRSEHLPLSLRPHAQHGISATRWSREHWTLKNIEMKPYLIASVEIPNNQLLWRLSGYMLLPMFLFPRDKDDHTYKTLLGSKMEKLLERIENNHGLDRGSLGRIDKYYP